MALRKKVQNFNKIIKTYKMKVNQKGMDALHRPSFFQSLNSKMSCPINDLLQSIGYTMSRLGFPKAHRSKGNGWWVIEERGCRDQYRCALFYGGCTFKRGGSQITYLEVGNDLFTNWK